MRGSMRRIKMKKKDIPKMDHHEDTCVGCGKKVRWYGTPNDAAYIWLCGECKSNAATIIRDLKEQLKIAREDAKKKTD